MSEMLPRDRVMAALEGRQPDRVPYIEIYVDEAFARALLNLPQLAIPSPMSGDAPLSAAYFGGQGFDPLDLASALGLDALIFGIQPQFYFQTTVRDGQYFVEHGLIRTREDLNRVQLVDPDSAPLDEPARAFVDRVHARGLAAGCFINLGSDPVVLSMGWDALSYALYDDPGLVHAMMERYADWFAAAVRRINHLGFDFIWAGDDIAFRSGPMISPAAFRRFFLPYYRRVAAEIRLPWIFHTDGNFLPILEDLLSLGMNALHPIEPDALDIRTVQRQVARRAGLVGNVDINLLALGTPEEVETEVRRLLRELAPGGRYILSSSNSITRACRLDTVRAMVQAVRTWGRYPIVC